MTAPDPVSKPKHSIKKCVHGRVVSRCRCRGPHDVVIVDCPPACHRAPQGCGYELDGVVDVSRLPVPPGPAPGAHPATAPGGNPPYTDDDVDALADVITDARMNGIIVGPASLARWILDRGWRRTAEVPTPAPAVLEPAADAPTDVGTLTVHRYEPHVPLAEAPCTACGHLLLYNLTVGVLRHDDPANDDTCTGPWPGPQPGEEGTPT